MKSGYRLEQAIVAAEKDSVEGRHCPKAASVKAESANVLAADTEWLAARTAANREAMKEHTVSRDWSYIAEIEDRLEGRMP